MSPDSSDPSRPIETPRALRELERLERSGRLDRHLQIEERLRNVIAPLTQVRVRALVGWRAALLFMATIRFSPQRTATSLNGTFPDSTSCMDLAGR